jgi:hypothetical protein
MLAYGLTQTRFPPLALDPMHLGSSFSLRVSSQPKPAFLVYSLTRLEEFLLVPDSAHFGSSMLPRILPCSGDSTLVYGITCTNLPVLLLDFCSIDSPVFTQSFIRVEASPAAYGVT